MPRAAWFTLLIAVALSGALQAQRGGASFRGSAASQVRGLPRGLPMRTSPRSGPAARIGSPAPDRRGRDAWGSYFLPLDDLLPDQVTDAETVASGPVPPMRIPPPLQPASSQSQFIEIPAAASSSPTKIPPPTVFVLADGERFEAQRFVLFANSLLVTIDRKQHTLPLEKLDLQATISANRERGIDLRIPNDRNEISLSF